MRFFLPLVASKDFLELEPEEILTFLKSNYICVTSEVEVLMAGVRWLCADWSNRRQLAVDVMRCVRFGLISPWQLVDIKRNPDNGEILEIVNEPEVQQMVDDGLAYVIIKYWYGNNSKNYYHWIEVLGLTEPAERNWIGEEKNHVTYKDFLKYLEQFMVPKEQIYHQMSMMQPPRRNDDIPGSIRGIDNDKLDMRRPKMDFPLPLALKGMTGDKDKFPNFSDFFDNRKKNTSSDQYCMIKTNDKRHSVAASYLAAATAVLSSTKKYSENGLTVPRKNFGLVVHRMALYAIGGQDKKGRVLRSVERFDPKTGSWNEVRPMSVGRMAVATVKYRDYIWVAGGMTGEKKRPVCKIVECYNSKTNEWTEIHSLRFPRCFATLFAMNDRLYIVGGAGKMSDKDKTASSVGAIDIWDWKGREWKLETEMSIPRHGHALAYLGTQLIIIG
ncbi:unnamed protein product [Diatraea saccharalis]|uniref:BACK domain-containing protein n=1 Tax=Diatraea saccharalis TaxID=40085 RepID=A0A9N9QV06_9NEOP|nr:unnamed protein product [Diatraea saccharalis]